MALALVAGLALASAPAALATTPHIVVRANYTDVLNDVMCTSCHEPLALAQSPQAISERSYIRGLIARGDTKPQIENALVAQYGEAVLGKPPASGFNLTVYVLPPALVLAGIAFLAFTLPKWRRRARLAASTPLAAGPALGTADAQRLDEDLARFE
ncbi:MAG: cytochrome c-type biogenesis protein CcmH [Actinomycetota bacterium]|nr:cytochrome c-type biogenesis protein CcmH [Actinomycetota bacterium]